MPVLHLGQVGLAAYTDRATQSLPLKPFEYIAASLPIISFLHVELARLLAAERIGLQDQARNAKSLTDALQTFAEDKTASSEMGRRERVVFLQRNKTASIDTKFIRMLETIPVAHLPSPAHTGKRFSSIEPSPGMPGIPSQGDTRLSSRRNIFPM